MEEEALETARATIETAIRAHGGFDALKAASTWVAEVRRHQRGESYVVTSHYRPGMVRMEQDLGDGERSADVIGDPHCWGMYGPVSIPCSDETRENDRPRVIMEMAVQLWPLLEEDWELLGVAEGGAGDRPVHIVTARYVPRDSLTTLSLDQESGLLATISIDGVKRGVQGTHLHEYSDFREFCGVTMPAHNVKSFEGEVWVEEDVLELECRPVDEAMFHRPAQVEEGTVVETELESGGPALSIFSLRPYDEESSQLADALRSAAAARGLAAAGEIQIRQLDNDGMGPTGELVVELQLPVAPTDAAGSS